MPMRSSARETTAFVGCFRRCWTTTKRNHGWHAKKIWLPRLLVGNLELFRSRKKTFPSPHAEEFHGLEIHHHCQTSPCRGNQNCAGSPCQIHWMTMTTTTTTRRSSFSFYQNDLILFLVLTKRMMFVYYNNNLRSWIH